MDRRVWMLGLGALALVVSFSGSTAGQNPPAAPPAPYPAAPPIDLTGYWVSVVTEDWRYRMVTPPRGDVQGVPVTPEGMRTAEAWDPDADEKAGEQCRSYGAPGVMRTPGRLHITWVEVNKTLKVETDAGTQTRIFHLGEAPAAELAAPRSWQGVSVASWEVPPPPRITYSATRSLPMPNPPQPRNGSLKVVTTHMRPGYLRKNGITYGENAELMEYFDIVREGNGTPWLVVTAVVTDARYLMTPFVVSSHFKKQADATGWDPTPCSSTW